MRFRRAPEAAAPAPAQAPAQAPVAEPAPATGTARDSRDLKRRAITIGLTLIAMVLIYLAASAFIPRWWAHRISGAVNGQLSTGTLLGLCFGLVFTILPLGLLWLTMRRPMHWKTRLAWVVLALILAAPNLMTLGVAVGTGSGAHAGQRTMDVNAPMFRGATLIGTLIAAVVFITMIIVYRRRAPKAPAAAA